MREFEGLTVGSFYWVIPVNDPDALESWEMEAQPARLRGYSECGEPLWSYINGEGDDWPVRWVGPRLTPPH